MALLIWINGMDTRVATVPPSSDIFYKPEHEYLALQNAKPVPWEYNSEQSKAEQLRTQLDMQVAVNKELLERYNEAQNQLDKIRLIAAVSA